MLMTLVVVALAVSNGEPSTVVVAGLVTIALAAVLVSRYASTVVRGRAMTMGERARQHREGLREVPAPRHPNTAGRPRTRAPAQVMAAA